MEEGTNNLAKVSAALLVVRMSTKLGARKLHPEGHSLIVIQALMKGDIEAWHLQGWIYNIIEELNYFNEYQISHIR